MTGWMRPTLSIDRASSWRGPCSMSRRGCRGLGRIAVIGSSVAPVFASLSTCGEAGVSPRSSARPRPSPPFFLLGTLNHLLCQVEIGVGPGAVRVK